jgi:hypothetical protein
MYVCVCLRACVLLGDEEAGDDEVGGVHVRVSVCVCVCVFVHVYMCVCVCVCAHVYFLETKKRGMMR